MARTEKVIMTNMCMVFSENRVLVQDKPLMVTVPELDGMTPQMIFIVVDFPAPFGPN